MKSYGKKVLKLTIDNQKVEINKGVMQGSIISPALFNILIDYQFPKGWHSKYY